MVKKADSNLEKQVSFPTLPDAAWTGQSSGVLYRTVLVELSQLHLPLSMSVVGKGHHVKSGV